MTTTENNSSNPKGMRAGTQFALWAMGYLLVALSIYAENTANDNPIFRYGTDNMGWLNGIQAGDNLRETLYQLFSRLLPRAFDDNWTAYLVLMCLILWLNGCLANLVCQALVHRYGLQGASSTGARSLAGGAAGLLVVTYNTGVLLAVNAFVYPLNCFLLLLCLLLLMTYLRTTKLRYWVVLLLIYVLAAKTSSYSWFFPLVLIAIEASSGPARTVRRFWLVAALRYLPLIICAVFEMSEHRNPSQEAQLDVLAFLSPAVLLNYLSHLAAATSLTVTASNFNSIRSDFMLSTGPALVMGLVLLLSIAGYVRSLPRRATLSALPFVLFALWGVCSYIPLYQGAGRQIAALHRSYYNILGLTLLAGVMLGAVVWSLCKRRAPALRGLIYASVSIVLVLAVLAARPSVAKGLRLVFSRPLPTFPGCQQDRRCAKDGRPESQPAAAEPGDGRLAACGDATHLALRGVDLTGKDLNNIRLTDVSIHHSMFSGVSLSGSCAALARISESKFDDAILDGADLSSSTLSAVSLIRANLDRAVLKGTFNTRIEARRASFRGANMHISEWRKCDFRSADLSHALLSHSFILDSKLAGANLYGTNLQGSMAANSDLSKVDLRKANIMWSHLHNSILRGADLREANMESASVIRCDLSKADLRKANMKSGKFHGSDLSGADLRGAVLADADLAGTNLAGARLAGSDTQGALVEGATVCQRDAAHLRGTRGTPKLVPCLLGQTGADSEPSSEENRK